MNSGKNKFTLELNTDGVMSPLSKTLELCSNSILFGLQSIELVKDTLPDLKINGIFSPLQYGNQNIDNEEKGKVYKQWLIKKGVEDLIKGIEASLIEAYQYVSLFNRFSKQKELEGCEFNKLISSIKKKSLEMHIPELLKIIEPSLTKSLNYKKQILSINKCRNCLVHRGGTVSKKDINEIDSETMKIEYKKLKLFKEKNGIKNEITGKGPIYTGDKIYNIFDDEIILFKLGEVIDINYEQFNNFILTCHLFGKDLVSSLPKNI